MAKKNQKQQNKVDAIESVVLNFSTEGWEDYEYWVEEDIDTVKKITPQKWFDNQVSMPIDNTMHNWLMNEYLTYYKDTDTIGSPRTDKSFKEQGIQFFFDALYQNIITAKFLIDLFSLGPHNKSICSSKSLKLEMSI